MRGYMSNASSGRLRSLIVPVGIVVVTGLLIAVIVLGVRGSGGDTAPGQAGPDLSYVETRESSDVRAAGPVDAPVALVVYSDYQCPFCAAWSNDILPTMMAYAERGELRIEWRDVNQYGADSERAALAAYAAGLQGKFWEYHDQLFEGGGHLPPDQLTEAGLTDIAAAIGLDTELFAADLSARGTKDAVRASEQAGQDLGVSGTPTFVLGGEPIVGAQPESVFVETFERALSRAR